MNLPISFLQSRRLSIYSGSLLSIAFGSFAWAHWVGYTSSHEWTLLLFCFSEMLSALFLLVRSAPETVSTDRMDWMIGIAGTFAPLLLRPTPWSIAPQGRYLIIAGVVIQIAGLLSLNRSLAIVAAKRSIKTAGPYRFVRHPLYASYFVTCSGYLLMNTSIKNGILYLLTMLLLLARISREEKHLALDELYLDYMRRVNYRVIPFIY